jgi:ureidoglycolate lyase
MERHFNVTQAFIPMDGSVSVVAVAPPTDPKAVPRPEQVRAFLIDGTIGFRYKVGTWHSLERFVLHPPGATFVIINVEPNPTQVVDFDRDFGLAFKVVL